MQGGYGTQIVGLPYGNGGSSNGSLPMINNLVSPDIPVSRMAAPSLTSAPRLPLIERVTPRSLPAGKTLNHTAARARVRATTTMRRAGGWAAGHARALRTRFFQDIGTPLISK